MSGAVVGARHPGLGASRGSLVAIALTRCASETFLRYRLSNPSTICNWQPPLVVLRAGVSMYQGSFNGQD